MRDKIEQTGEKRKSPQMIFDQVIIRLRDDLGLDRRPEKPQESENLRMFEDAVQALCS